MQNSRTMTESISTPTSSDPINSHSDSSESELTKCSTSEPPQPTPILTIDTIKEKEIQETIPKEDEQNVEVAPILTIHEDVLYEGPVKHKNNIKINEENDNLSIYRENLQKILDRCSACSLSDQWPEFHQENAFQIR